MSPEELAQIQHVIQASHSIQQPEEIKPLLETIDAQRYSQIFRAALSDIHKLKVQQPQADVLFGTTQLIVGGQHNENNGHHPL